MDGKRRRISTHICFSLFKSAWTAHRAMAQPLWLAMPVKNGNGQITKEFLNPEPNLGTETEMTFTYG